jgi:hypothetical protein
MSREILTNLELLQNFAALPDDVLVPPKVAALVLGESEWTLRRHPVLPRVQLSPRRYGHRVGDLRAYARGVLPRIVA